MLKYNDKEIRNLVEQVQKNKEDIANHYAIDRALANFGIKIVGTVSSTSQLPGSTVEYPFPLAPEYNGEFGDGYAVGQPGSYIYYIYTRADLNGGKPTSYWLDVGSISIVGPEGPQGPQGEKGDTGERGSRWFAGSTGTSEVSNPLPGDKFLSVGSGEVFNYTGEENGWVLVGNIRGPQGVQGIQGIQGPQGEQGPQGLKGDTGDVGGFINIAGIITNTSQLPSPESLGNLSVAYLVGENKDLYIQVGATSDTAIWNNVGPFNAATLVMVNGLAQNVWDADTKLDKVTSSGFLRAYCVNPDGSQNTISIASNANTWKTDRMPSLMRSTAGSEDDRSKMEGANVGYLLSPAPVQPFHTVNKEYVDENFAPNLIKDNPNYGLVQAVVMTAKQGSDPRKYAVYTISTSTGGVQSGRIAQYFGDDSGAEGTALGNGRILQQDPTQPLQVTNKRYVDNSTKTYRHKISGSLINTASETKVINFIVYNNNPNSLITPDTTKTTFPTIATKYLQPSTPVMFQQTSSEYEMDMIKVISSNALNLVVSGDRYNFSTALEFTDNVTEM